MPVMSLEECQPYLLQPLTEVAVPTLYESHAFLLEVLDAHPELHDVLDTSTKASMLSNIFARMARPRFAELGINWQQIGRMQSGNVGGVINMRFKKLTLDLHSMNVPTIAQAAMYHQYMLPGMSDVTHVTFGYIPDDITRTIAGAFCICPRAWTRNHWTWCLAGGDGGAGGLFEPVEPIDPEVNDQNLEVVVSMNSAQVESA